MPCETPMPTCPKCHTVAAPEDKYCGQCGIDLHDHLANASSLTEHALDVTEVKYRLGLVYYKKNDIPNASKLWNEVLEIDERHSGALQMLAKVAANSDPEDEEGKS